MNDKKVYIIILNYNGWQDTIECLESVLKNDYPNYQVVVIDNNSPNNSMQKLIEWAKGKQEVIYKENSKLKHLSQPFERKPIDYVYYTKEEAIKGGDKEKESKLKNPIIFIQAGENRGFAAGNNIGIKYALAKGDFEYICLLNNDTVVEKNFLSLIITKMEKDKNIGICSGKINYYDNPEKIWFNGGYFNKFTSRTKHYDYGKKDINQRQTKVVNFLTGCLWVIRKEVLEKVGLLNEEYFMYVEDLEYSYKTIKAGFKLEMCSESKIYHKVGSSNGGEISEFGIYWFYRNKLLFLLKRNKILFILFLFNMLFKLKNSNIRKIILKAINDFIKCSLI
jgi:GT2 family glycosyltransferase